MTIREGDFQNCRAFLIDREGVEAVITLIMEIRDGAAGALIPCPPHGDI